MSTIKTYRTKLWAVIVPIMSGILLLLIGVNGYLIHDNYTLLIIGILFGVTSISGILNLFSSISSLIASPKGLMAKSFFRKTFVEWNKIESFENKKILFQNRIAIHLKPTFGKKFLGISMGKRRNNYTAVLPMQYNVKVEELQERLKNFNHI